MFLTICHILHVSLTTASCWSCWKEMKCLRSGRVLPRISERSGLSFRGPRQDFSQVQSLQPGAEILEKPSL